MKNTTFDAAPERAVQLQTEQLVRVSGPLRLRAVRGTLWLTVDGHKDDHVLVPGQQFELRRGAGAIVQAIFAPACAMVADEAASAWLPRAAKVLRVASRRLTEAFA